MTFKDIMQVYVCLAYYRAVSNFYPLRVQLYLTTSTAHP